MKAPTCQVLRSKVSRRGSATCLDITLHEGVRFRFVFSDPYAAEKTGCDLAIASKAAKAAKSKAEAR